MDNNNAQKQIQLELKPEIARGTYSNLAIITHSHSEFIIDFATMLPGQPKPEVSNRIISPCPISTTVPNPKPWQT